MRPIILFVSLICQQGSENDEDVLYSIVEIKRQLLTRYRSNFLELEVRVFTLRSLSHVYCYLSSRLLICTFGFSSTVLPSPNSVCFSREDEGEGFGRWWPGPGPCILSIVGMGSSTSLDLDCS